MVVVRSCGLWASERKGTEFWTSLVTARGFLIPFRKLGKCEKTRKGKSGQGRVGEGGALVTSFAEYVYRFQWVTYFI